ncbi:MAG: hypothetical protein R2801_11130, partial [Chitinophagales bacterium]
KNLIILFVVFVAISCKTIYPIPNERIVGFFNNTNKVLLFKFYDLDGYTDSLTFTLQPNTEIYPAAFNDREPSDLLQDSLYLMYDNTKHQIFLKSDTNYNSTNRNVFFTDSISYKREDIFQGKNYLYKYTYTFTEADYAAADSIP